MPPDDDNNLPARAGGTAPSHTVASAARSIASLMDPPEDDSADTRDGKSDSEAEDADADAGDDQGADPDAEPVEGEEEEGGAEAEEGGDDGESDEEEQEESDAEEESGPVQKIKLDDGTEITLEEAKLGYQRQADYTRKTQDLARKEQELTGEREQLRQTETRTAELVDIAMQVIQHVMVRPNRALADTDPNEYTRQMADFEGWQEWLRDLDGRRQQAASEFDQRTEKARKNHMTEERRRLLEAMPELKEKGALSKWRGNLLQQLPQAYGFTEDEILSTADHRILRMASDAAKWRSLQEKKPDRLKEARRAPPVTKPGPRRDPKKAAARLHAKASEKLRKTGRVEDAATAIAQLLK